MPTSPPRRLRRNPLEWVILIASLALLAAVLAILGLEVWRNGGERDAKLEVELDRLQPRRQGFAAEVLVRNTGTGTAEDVTIVVTFAPPGESEQTGEILLPHVPAGARRRGWVEFNAAEAPASVSAAPLQVRVQGYRTP